jgi:hypothetical protein
MPGDVALPHQLTFIDAANNLLISQANPSEIHPALQ